MTLESRLQAIEQRVQFLTDWETKQIDALPEKFAAEARERAAYMAVRSMVYELVLHAGISEEALEAAIEERTRFFHAHLLSVDTGEDKSFISQVDDREPDEVCTEDDYKPLFDE